LKLEERLECSFRNHGINRIQAGGVNLNENLVRLERGAGNVGERDIVGITIFVEDECFHKSVEVKFTMGNSV
jgi:hypothetical protein